MPVAMAAASKFKPAKLRALVASLKPRYTQSAPLSTAALSAGRLPAGQTSSGGVRGAVGALADGDWAIVFIGKL